MATKEEIDKRLEAALEAEIPHIYFNTSVHQIGLADVLMVLERNGKPVVILNTSITAAKSMVEVLNTLIQGFEQQSGVPVKSTMELEKSFKKETTKKKSQ